MRVFLSAACLLGLAASTASSAGCHDANGGMGVIGDESAASPAPDPPPVHYLTLVEGDPGVPGDGKIVGAAGGLSGLRFEVDPGSSPISLGDAADGLTITAFPPSTAPASTVNLQVVLATEGRLRHPCSIAIAGTGVPAPSVNGIQGTAIVLSRDELDAYAGVVRSRPGCSHVSPAALFLSGIVTIDGSGWNVGQLDALAAGFGTNVFPSGSTPPATASAAP